MDTFLSIDITTPENNIFSGKAKSIKVPGKLSPFEILINHAPIVSSLNEGIVRLIDENNKEIKFQSGKGFIEVNKNQVAIFVDSATLL